MKEGKWNLAFIAFCLVLVLSMTLVSAQGLSFDIRYEVQRVIDTGIEVFAPIFDALLGDGSGDEFLFERILIFVVLITLIYAVLGRVPLFDEKNSIRWIVAIIIPLIGVRFIDPGWLYTIIFSYGILSVALLGILPFIIYFVFVQSFDSTILRKICWIFYIIVYFGLWSTAEMGQVEIYFWTMVAAILFLSFDGTFRRVYIHYMIKESGHKTRALWRTEVNENIRKLRERLRYEQDKSSIRTIEKEIKRLDKVIRRSYSN